MKSVSRGGRLLDLAGLVLVLSGAGILARSWVGFQSLRTYVAPVDAAPWSAVAMADQYSSLRITGAAVMIAGVAVFVVAWWVAGRERS